MLPRLLIASDRGYLNHATLSHLHACGYKIIAAVQGRDSLRKCTDLGIKTLTRILPQWQEAPREATADSTKSQPLMRVPPDWRQALAASDSVIYASEPREDWATAAPDYTTVCHAPLQLLQDAIDARVKTFIFISAGKAQGFTRSLIAEEWDGNVYQEEIQDPFEAQRGVHLPEASVQALYLWYLHQRQYRGFRGIFARSPVTHLIWLTPEYISDPAATRSYDAEEVMASVRVEQFTQVKYHTDYHCENWSHHSLLQALERILRERHQSSF